MIGSLRPPLTKQELVSSIQSTHVLRFAASEIGSVQEKLLVMKSLDRSISMGPVSGIIMQEK